MKKQTIKICFICYRRFPDTNFDNYSRVVAENGYDVSIISYHCKNQSKYEFNGKRVIRRIRLPYTKSNRKKVFIFIKETVKILRKHKFPVIHIHHTCAYFLLIKLLNFKKAKYIYHITSYPIAESHFQSMKQMVVMFFQSLFMDEIIIQSHELKEKLIGIRRLSRAVVVPIGYNAKLFYPHTEKQKEMFKKKLKLGDNEFILIYIGVISRFRKLDRLIESFKIVTKKIPNVKLMMIGNGNDIDNLKLSTKNLGLEKKVIFFGRVSHKRIPKYLNIADIGISYVPINENYNYNPPLKTFEYLACGLPTIATKTVSNCKIIKNEFNGILINDDPWHMANAIIQLFFDKNKQNYLSKNAIKSVMSKDFETITNQRLIPIYDNL